MIGNSVNVFESQDAAAGALAQGRKKRFSAGVQRIYKIFSDQDLWRLSLPPAGTGSKEPHVKASKVISRISKDVFCKEELKFGLCLQGTCYFTLREGGLIFCFCSIQQQHAINSSNSKFSKRLELVLRERMKCTVLGEGYRKDSCVIKVFGIPELQAKSQLCYISSAWAD